MPVDDRYFPCIHHPFSIIPTLVHVDTSTYLLPEKNLEEICLATSDTLGRGTVESDSFVPCDSILENITISYQAAHKCR